MADAYSFISVKKPSSDAGRPTGKKAYIVLFKWADVKTVEKDEKGIRFTKLEFQSEKKPIGVYATQSTINAYAQSEGDDDARGYIHHLDFEHPGTEIEYDEMMNAIINEDLGAIVVGCNGNDAKVCGSPCAPLHVTQDNSQDNSEGNKNTVQLQSTLRSTPLGRIAKNLIPVTDDAEVNALLGLTGVSPGA
jgi:hypothetical protein